MIRTVMVREDMQDRHPGGFATAARLQQQSEQLSSSHIAGMAVSAAGRALPAVAVTAAGAADAA